MRQFSPASAAFPLRQGITTTAMPEPLPATDARAIRNLSRTGQFRHGSGIPPGLSLSAG